MKLRKPEIRDTFVVRKETQVHYVLVVTSVDHQKDSGTFRFFNTEKEAHEFCNQQPTEKAES